MSALLLPAADTIAVGSPTLNIGIFLGFVVFTLGIVIKVVPRDGTTTGVGGHIDFYVPNGVQVTDVAYLIPDDAGGFNKAAMKGQSPIAIGDGPIGAKTTAELIGLPTNYASAASGITAAPVSATGLHRGTIAGVYGDTGIFYSTAPDTNFDSWVESGGVGTAPTTVDRWMRAPGKARGGAIGLAAGLGLLWAGATWQRSQVWFDDETLWRDALAKYPESSNVLGNLAQGLLDRKPEEAGRLADRALAITPGDGQTMLVKAILAQRAGEYEASLEWLDKASSLDASPTAIADLRGKIHARQGEYRKAILSYGAIMEIEPQSLTHYGLMALASLALGDEGGALACLQEMERLDANMAKQAQALRKFVPEYSSLSPLRQRMVLIPGLLRHQYELAQNCQFEQKDNARALREYRLLLAHYPAVVDFWTNASQHVPKQIDMPQIADIRQNHVRKLAVAFYNQACLLSLSGETEDARAALRQAFRYDPSLEKSAATDPDLAALRESTGW